MRSSIFDFWISDESETENEISQVNPHTMSIHKINKRKNDDANQKQTLSHTESVRVREWSHVLSTSRLGGETWEKHKDSKSGKIFYYNIENKVTQWTVSIEERACIA